MLRSWQNEFLGIISKLAKRQQATRNPLSMKTLALTVIAVFAGLLLSACENKCSPGSAYSCSQLAEKDFNVFFIFPGDNKEAYLGLAKGLDQCRSTALRYAGEQKLSLGSGWSQVCCLKTTDSECAEKLR
jgi:hypothetical protein